MGNVIMWALLTGLVTGGVWVGIVVFQLQRRMPAEERADLLEHLQQRMAELEHVSKRLADVEERLDFAERLLNQQREAPRLPPPS